MRWFYAALVFLAVIPLTSLIETSFPLAGLIYFIGNPTALLIWNWAECEKQRKLLKTLFANRYPRRWLFGPIALTILFTFAWLILCGMLLATLSPHRG